VHQSVLDFPLPWSHVRAVALVQQWINDRRHFSHISAAEDTTKAFVRCSFTRNV
jgi:hypothetical protein